MYCRGSSGAVRGMTDATTGETTRASKYDPILVFGPTGGTGEETIRRLVAREVSVTAFVRPTSVRTALEPLGVRFVEGEALVREDVDRAFAADAFAAVVCSLGGRRGEPRPDYDGVRHVVDAARDTGVSRVVLVSSIGAGDATREPPPSDAGFMRRVLYEKTRGEDYLIESGLRYTIVRPGGLRTEPPTGRGELTEAYAMGMIHRADVADLVVRVLDDETTVGKVFHAIDPSLPMPGAGASSGS